MLPKKKELFKKLLEDEEERTNRHFASRKLLEEKWVLIDDYLKNSLNSIERVGNYLYQMVEFYKRESRAYKISQAVILPSQHPHELENETFSAAKAAIGKAANIAKSKIEQGSKIAYEKAKEAAKKAAQKAQEAKAKRDGKPIETVKEGEENKPQEEAPKEEPAKTEEGAAAAAEAPKEEEVKKEREDSFLPVLTSLHDYNKELMEKYNKLVETLKTSVSTKIQPVVDDLRFMIRDLSATYDDLAFKYEESGKKTYLMFDKMDATLASTIKSVSKNGKSKEDFYLVYAGYICAVHNETDCRRELVQYLGNMFEKVKKIEVRRVESCTTVLEEYFNLVRNLYDESAPLVDPVVTNLKNVDLGSDMKVLIKEMKEVKDKVLNDKEKEALTKESVSKCPKFTNKNEMIIKYGIMTRWNYTSEWEIDHIVISQDRHMLSFASDGEMNGEKYFQLNGLNPMADIDLTCSTVIRMKSYGDFCFQIVEKVKKMGFLPTIGRYYFKFDKDESYQDWLETFRKLNIPIEIEVSNDMQQVDGSAPPPASAAESAPPAADAKI